MQTQTSFHTIVTHPGSAHRDDFLAVCWSLADDPFIQTYRREPTEDDLNNAGVRVIDTGRHADADLNNWDHHQLDRDAPSTCALQMLIEHDLGKERAHQVFPWLDLTGVVDSKGPSAAAAKLEVPVDAFIAMNSPVEKILLDIFSGCTDLRADNDALAIVMSQIGRILRNRVVDIEDAIASTKIVEIEVAGLPAMVFLRNNNKPPHKLFVVAMDIYRRKAKAEGRQFALSVSPDDRGPGYTLYRYDDNFQLDFARIAKDPRVGFAHSNGFIAKLFGDVTWREIEELVTKSKVVA